MTLRLYDSRTRATREFEPINPGTVGIYVCGPTVQDAPHIGHLRSAIAFDVLRRWLTESGYEVVLIRNVTDIDDKILHAAGHAGEPWWALGERHNREFDEAYEAAGVLPPTLAPRATGHIPEMVALMHRLIEAGHAYPSGGDVYFDVRSFPDYGNLSGQKLDAMQATERTDTNRPKRDPLDFALWKAARPGEPSWQTPWGPGRPGWHLECSAMATKYLGPTFDIHGGGLDLLFPHHENELAQSVSAGDGFARFWLHNGMVNIGPAKMSKSLGNSLFALDLFESLRPAVVRYALLAPHYRSELTWSDGVLAEADAALSRVENFLRAVGNVAFNGQEPADGPAWQAFAEAMDDDLSLPRALAVLHSAVREGNAALEVDPAGQVQLLARQVRRMVAVLGLDSGPAGSADGRLTAVADGLVQLVLDARAGARKRRDYTEADRIRERLAGLGVSVEDTAGGVRWRIE